MKPSEGDQIRIETDKGFWATGTVKEFDERDDSIPNFVEDDWGGVELQELVTEDDTADDSLFLWDVDIILDGTVTVWVPSGTPDDNATEWEDLHAGEVTNWEVID